MKLPQNIALECSQNRAASRRLYRIRAALSTPRPEPANLGRSGLEAAAANRRRAAAEAERAALAEARKADGRRVAAEVLRRERRKVGPRLAAELAAKAAPAAPPPPKTRPDGGPAPLPSRRGPLTVPPFSAGVPTRELLDRLRRSGPSGRKP